MAEELQLSGRSELVAKLLGKPSAKVQQLAESDIGAGPASGSYPSDGMIILPCSMGTLAGIANGLASNLIERAADVSLKERRPLILCIRETPFNKIHLRNMSLAADAGAVIFPVIPAFYNRPMDCSRDGGAVRLPGAGAHRIATSRTPMSGRAQPITDRETRCRWCSRICRTIAIRAGCAFRKSTTLGPTWPTHCPGAKMPAVRIHIQLRLQYLRVQSIADRKRNQPVLLAPADQHRHGQRP